MKPEDYPKWEGWDNEESLDRQVLGHQLWKPTKRAQQPRSHVVGGIVLVLGILFLLVWGLSGCAGATETFPTVEVPEIDIPIPTVEAPELDTPLPSMPRSGCDPSYPSVCIPSAPPDLDCGDIPHRRFQVIGVDPHGFDGDGDGVGCER
jgi:hypothetical protein